MKTIDASLIYMLDKPGRIYSNSSSLQATVDKLIPLTEFRWEQVSSNLFLGEVDGWYQYHHHDGSEDNHGGYGGRHFSIIMKDGSEKILRGPWSGGEYSVWRDAGIKLINLDLREKDSIFTSYCFGYATTVDRVVEEILPLVRPVNGEGSHLFSASIITTNPASRDERWHTEYAITKGKSRHLIDNTILEQWR